MTSDAQMPKPASIPATHESHDQLLVARLSSGDDLTPVELDEARALVAACAECGILDGDLRAISAAVAVLPAPRRPRDFRLSEPQAGELRGSPIRRFLQRLTLPGAAALRPLAGSAVALGLTLAVVGVALPGPAAKAPAPVPDEQLLLQAPAASSPGDMLDEEARIRSEAQPAAGVAASGGPEEPGAAEAVGVAPAGGDEGSGADAAQGGAPAEAPNDGDAGDTARQEVDVRPAEDTTQASKATVPGDAVPLPAIGLLLAAAGVLVLTLVWAARRVTADPLLR